MTMNKTFSSLILLSSAVLLAACSEAGINQETPKTTAEEINAPVQDGLYSFDVNISDYSSSTKAKKTGWENGDVIFVFFDDATTQSANTLSDIKYVTFTYNGSGWTAEQANAPAESELSESGTLNAVFCPFGSQTITAGDTEGTFYVSKSNSMFLQDTGVIYTKSGSNISFSLTMKLADEDVAQIYIPADGLDTSHSWSLSVYGTWDGSSWSAGLQKTWSATFTPASGTFSSITNTLGKPVDGYSYGGGLVFYGHASLGSNAELLFELYDNTDGHYYTYDKTSVSAFTGKMAIKLPTISSWTTVNEAKTLIYADGTLLINEPCSPYTHYSNVLAHGSYDILHSGTITSLGYGDDGSSQPWASVRSSVKSVVFGSSTKPTSMQGAFISCTALTTVDTANLDLSSCTSLKYAFKSCSSLTTLDTSGWDTAKVTDLRYAFQDCKKLEVLDVSGWNVSNVGNMYGVFRQCEKVSALDLSNWTNTKATRSDEMFRGCFSITSLDISGLNIEGITRSSMMFYQCTSLQTIYSDADFSPAVTTTNDREFYQCYALAGGNGTTWSNDHVDISYAVIDKEGTPGYFTEKK